MKLLAKKVLAVFAAIFAVPSIASPRLISIWLGSVLLTSKSRSNMFPFASDKVGSFPNIIFIRGGIAVLDTDCGFSKYSYKTI